MKKLLLSFCFVCIAIWTVNAQTVYIVTKKTDPDPFTHPYNYDDSICDSAMYGTLQWAVRKCMDTPSSCRIEFNIPGNGPHTIQLSYSLQVIKNRSIFIDGSTQHGYTYGHPQILLDGNTKLMTGLSFTNADYS